jgi:hypothetical protein
VIRPLTVTAIFLLLVIGCATHSGGGALQEPVASDHFETKFAGFLFDRGSRKARYLVEFLVRKPFSRSVDLRIEFENPQDFDRPIIVERVLDPKESSFELESPALPAIQNGGTYRVLLLALDPSSEAELARHSQLVWFNLPPDFFNAP